MELFGLEFALSVDEVWVLGEWAFERGTYTISLNPKAGGPSLRDAGKYITIYQRKPGDSWRMARDIWNSSNPPPGSRQRSRSSDEHCRLAPSAHR
jgi:ketosteroid isomerase-like protein